LRLPLYFGFGDVIDIYSKPDIQTASGGWTDDWPVFAQHVNCDVIPTGANETMIGDHYQTEIMYSVVVPVSVRGILSSMMAIWKGHELYFTAVMPEVAENGVQIITAREQQFDDNMAQMA
jgi:hypothetical protein